MENIKLLFKSKRNIIGILVFLVILAAIPLTLSLVKSKQTTKTKASENDQSIQVMGATNGTISTTTVNLQLHYGPNNGPEKLDALSACQQVYCIVGVLGRANGSGGFEGFSGVQITQGARPAIATGQNGVYIFNAAIPFDIGEIMVLSNVAFGGQNYRLAAIFWKTADYFNIPKQTDFQRAIVYSSEQFPTCRSSASPCALISAGNLGVGVYLLNVLSLASPRAIVNFIYEPAGP